MEAAQPGNYHHSHLSYLTSTAILPMLTHLRPALVLFLVITLVCGFAYPCLVTSAAQTFFPFQANGSLVVKDNRVLGSRLVAQCIDDPRYFWGRPSATPGMPCNASQSSGSNLNPSNPRYVDAVRQRADGLKSLQQDDNRLIPIDLVTASGSGLDPHISPASALYQLTRVAKARQMPESQIRPLIDKSTEKPLWGFIGEERVNVFLLNLALDEL